jgi:hypothetical protein
MVAVLGLILLLIAGAIELLGRRRPRSAAPSSIRRPSVIVAAIGVVDLLIAVLLRFV